MKWAMRRSSFTPRSSLAALRIRDPASGGHLTPGRGSGAQQGMTGAQFRADNRRPSRLEYSLPQLDRRHLGPGHLAGRLDADPAQEHVNLAQVLGRVEALPFEQLEVRERS